MNVDDSKRKGRHTYGERQGNSKLTESQVREIKQLDHSIPVLAKMYHVSPQLIWGIRHNRIWRHVC